MDEPVLQPAANAYVYALTPRYPALERVMKNARSFFWHPTDTHFAQDVGAFRALPARTQLLFKKVMALFARADGLINANLGDQFLREARSQECQVMYSYQMTIEFVHAEVYAQMVQVYVEDAAERQQLLEGVEHYPSIREKQDWVLRWCDAAKNSFAERVVAFAAVECIFFASSFVIFYYAKWKKMLPGLSEANDWIARDESTHVIFACALYHELLQKLPVERAHAIIREATEVEQRFVDFLLLEDRVPDLTAADMRAYIELNANKLCELLSIPPLYKIRANPLPWVDSITLLAKANFFETPGVYKAAFESPDFSRDDPLDV